jgi:hypothetical protein
MENASQILDLSSPYKPRAIYLHDADTVEYVRKDVPCIYRRIDGMLTLALDLKDQNPIGFRFKGFKNFFLKHKTKFDLLEGDFISLVGVIEDALQTICDDVFKDTDRKKAYMQARKIAHEDSVALEEWPLAA